MTCGFGDKPCQVSRDTFYSSKSADRYTARGKRSVYIHIKWLGDLYGKGIFIADYIKRK